MIVIAAALRASVVVALCCMAAGSAETAALAAPGDLDPSFAGDGTLITHAMSVDALAIQRDGRIVIGGGSVSHGRARFALARYRADGTLDRPFGDDGEVTTAFPDRQCVVIDALKIQRDGRIVAAGRSGCSGGRFAVARYLASGRLDRSFSRDGRVTTSFGSTCRFSEAHGLAIQPEGSIVVAGGAGCSRQGRLVVTFALARYTRQGRLDSTFAGDGRRTTDVTPQFDQANDVVVQSDGRIVAVGTAAMETDSEAFALARYLPDGRLDATFGTGGKVRTLFTGDQDCSPAQGDAAALQADGRIVAAGMTGCGHPNFALARYLPDGSLDASFGGDGKVATIFAPGDCSDAAKDVAIEPDGRIVAAGVAGCGDPHPRFAIARYAANGTLDAGFGTGGKVATPIRAGGERCFEQINAVAVQRDGGIVAAGVAACGSGDTSAVARYVGGPPRPGPAG